MNKNIGVFSVLMGYAHELGKAKKSGDVEAIKIAQKNHDDYKEICLNCDEVLIGRRVDLD